MLAVYSPSGKIVGWLDNQYVYDENRALKAHIHHGGVFTYKNLHLGYFVKGYFVDKKGYAIAFTQGARGGPTHSTPPTAPAQSIPPTPPTPSTPPTPPIMPNISSNWSQISWERFLSGS